MASSRDVAVTVTWPGDSSTWTFGGPVEADDVVKVGAVSMTIPETLGELAVELVARDRDEIVAVNRYTTAVVMPTEA
jgi:beta-mannosidase